MIWDLETTDGINYSALAAIHSRARRRNARPTSDPRGDRQRRRPGRPAVPGGAGALRRFFAWGQATRWAVLVVLLEHAVRALAGLVFLAWAHRLLGWLLAPPARVLATQSANRTVLVAAAALLAPDLRRLSSRGPWGGAGEPEVAAEQE